MMQIFAGICMVVGGGIFFVRNLMVYFELKRLLDGARECIGTDEFWLWIKEIERVSEWDMILRFWVPVKEFHRVWWLAHGGRK
jgi:hypothetical protein